MYGDGNILASMVLNFADHS
jgi:hypothetical protein